MARRQCPTTLADILRSLFAKVGLLPAQYDVSAAEDVSVLGFTVPTQQGARDSLGPLLQFCQVDLAEYDGKIVAVKRGNPALLAIPEEDLACRVARESGGVEEGTPEGDLVTVTGGEYELPDRVTVNFFNEEKDYTEGSQEDIRYTKAHLQNPVTMTLPMTLTPTQGRQHAARMLYQAWVERESYTCTVPWKYLRLAPGDVVLLPVDGNTVRARLTQVNVGLFGPIALQAVRDDIGVLTQTAPGAPALPYVPVKRVTATSFVAWSDNALRNEDAPNPGLYMAGAGAAPGYWPGATVFWSRNGGATYSRLDELLDAAPLGVAATALPPGVTTGYWDDVNTLDVTMTTGTLTSTSEAAVRAGANALRVGREVIQFVTATSLGSNQYRLSRLLRGQRGTDETWGSHTVGETVVALDEGWIRRADLPPDLVGASILLKCVGEGQALAAATPVPLTITGNELRPYSVWHITGTRQPNSDLLLEWLPRSRTPLSWNSPATESPVAYEVDIKVGGNVVRTLTSSTESVTYSAGDQTTDGLVLTGQVEVCVFSISPNAAIGRGYGHCALVPGTQVFTPPATTGGGTLAFNVPANSGLIGAL